MRNRIVTIWVMVILLGSFWLSKPAVADSPWIIQTVDSTGYVGNNTSLALQLSPIENQVAVILLFYSSIHTIHSNCSHISNGTLITLIAQIKK